MKNYFNGLTLNKTSKKIIINETYKVGHVIMNKYHLLGKTMLEHNDIKINNLENIKRLNLNFNKTIIRKENINLHEINSNGININRNKDNKMKYKDGFNSFYGFDELNGYKII